MVTSRPFGFVRGEAVTAYTIENKAGMRLTVIDYGARIQSLTMPNGRETVLGYDSAEGYEADTSSMGAVCGRYANRISGGRFILNGTEYHLDVNNGKNTLHGGRSGFNCRMFKAVEQQDAVLMTLVSPDGDMGFPGELTLSVRYSLTEDAVRIEYGARATADTVLNITNHAYFNFCGGVPVYGSTLRVNAKLYLPTGEGLIPTGEIRSVAGTAFDLREPVRLGDRLDPLAPDLEKNMGYDNTFILDRVERGALEYAATLEAPDGLRMDCYTTEPSLQVYTANHLNITGREGRAFGPLTAVCLETQHLPDSMANTHFPSPVLKAGEDWRSVTEYRFS